MEEYFTKGLGGAETSIGGVSSTAKAQQTFDRYKDSSTGNIEFEGMQKFFDDLGISGGTDTITMYICYKMTVANMGTITPTEFI